MSRSPSPTPPKGSVRNMISIFENQSFTVSDEPTNLIRRTKSLGSLNQQPRVIIRKPVERVIEPEKNWDLAQIEQQIQHLQHKLSNNYRTYSRENHIYYQNQIIFIFTDLANVETSDRTVETKSDLTEVLKRLTKKLNTLLPAAAAHERVARTVPTEEKKVVTKVNTKEIVPVQKQEVVEEKEDEVDAAVSVKSLKEMFEKNTNENEGKRDFGGPTKITRKSQTFNGISDHKYVLYSEKYKTLDTEFQNGRDQSHSDMSEISRQVFYGSDDEKVEMSPDSLSHASSEESDDERSGEGEEVKGEN